MTRPKTKSTREVPNKTVKPRHKAQPGQGASLALLLAKTAPSFLPQLPASAPRKGEPTLLGETLPHLYRCGFPHLRFADTAASPSPVTETMDIFFGPWVGAPLLRSATVWSRFARAYAGSVKVLSSNPTKRAFTKEAKLAIANDELVTAEEAPGLIRELMSKPGSLRSREWTEDFIYALEALTSPEVVCDAIVSVFEKPPPGKALPQIKPLLEDVAFALGFVRLRLDAAPRKSLDARLTTLVKSPSTRFPTPTLRFEAFLRPDQAPRGAPKIDGTFRVSDVIHTTDKAPILAALERFQPKEAPLSLLDPRLVFLAGADAIPAYLAKFTAYERALHANVAAIQLRAFVDAIAPFRDPRVDGWLDGLTAHPHVGQTAKAWVAARR